MHTWRGSGRGCGCGWGSETGRAQLRFAPTKPWQLAVSRASGRLRVEADLSQPEFHRARAILPLLAALFALATGLQCSDPGATAAGVDACCGDPSLDLVSHFDASASADTAPAKDGVGADSGVIADSSLPSDASVGDSAVGDAATDTAKGDAPKADTPSGDAVAGCDGAPKPEECNGKDDDCDGKTDNGACDDGNTCTTDSCKPATAACSHSAKAGGCDDGNPCTTGEACSGTSCAGGQPASCDDNNPCTKDSCDPITGCKSLPLTAGSPCADDGDPCTGDTCDNGSCSHPIAAGKCKIAGQCVDAGSASPQTPCLVCDPAVTQAQYAPKDGGKCDDGNPCTTGDICQSSQCKGGATPCGSLDSACATGTCDPVGGGCIAVPKPAATDCDDGNPCTNQDKCDGSGACAAQPVSCATLDDACHSGVCSAGKCLQQDKPAGSSCSDGDACTQGDTCQAGKCSGPAIDCSAKSDICHTGVCSSGACTAANKPNGTPCDDKSACTSNDICSSGTCAGTGIKDAYEPNNSSGAAASLGAKSDCDLESSLTASLSPAGDSDWFTFTVSDDTFCTIKPNARVNNLSADYDVCIYFICAGKSASSDQVACSNGSKTGGTGPNGAFGCCSANAGTQTDFAKIDPTCSFLGSGSESGTVWVQVTAKSASACGDYKLVYAAKDL